MKAGEFVFLFIMNASAESMIPCIKKTTGAPGLVV